MGQVWSSADFDGSDEAGHQGGWGGPLAVTHQNPGPDMVDGTNDDVPAQLNRRPSDIAIDFVANDGCGNSHDRCRNFISAHTGGGLFLLGDGSVRFVSENIDSKTYIGLGTISGGELTGDF